MSVRTGFAIVGTAVGAYFGNASLGYAIGSMVGGYVDPVQVKGPRLTDAQTQTAQDGVPIPIIYGSVRISGNIIASGKLVEHRKVDDGKGSGTETTTYYYTRTYAIGICEGPIAAIRRIWRDGKLVFDQSPASLGSYENRASTRQFLAHSDIYLGTEDQTPNSALQAIFGVSNVPAHRGLAYVVIRDDDLTDRAGSIPQYEFEVVQESSPENSGELAARVYQEPKWKYPDAGSKPDPRADGQQYRYGIWEYSALDYLWFDSEAAALQYLGKGRQLMGWTYDVFVGGNQGSASTLPIAPADSPGEPQTDMRATVGLSYATDNYNNISEHLSLSEFTPEAMEGGRYIYSIDFNGDVYGRGVISNVPLPNSAALPIRLESGDYYISRDVVLACQVTSTCTLYPQSDWVEIPGTPGFYVDRVGNVHQVGDCESVSGSFVQLQAEQFFNNGERPTELYFQKLPTGPLLEVGDPRSTRAFWESAYVEASLAGSMPPGLTYGTDYPTVVETACFCALNTIVDAQDPLLADIVADLCFRKGLTTSDIDVSQLTDRVKGFTVATATSAADAINALAPAFQFDEAEWDGRIRFIKRGGPTLAALDEVDAFDSDSGRIVETRAQELELPRKMTLAYMDLDANYAVTTQTAERFSVSVDSSGTDQVQLSVVMNADKAAQTADVLLKDKWASINGTLGLSVGDEFSSIVPTDVLYLSYGEALFRARAVEVENADGIVKLQLQQDTAGAYSSIKKGVPPRPAEEGTPTVLGPTFLEILNLPALRDQDDLPGLYLAACGPFGSWPGAQVAVSADGGQTWKDVLQMKQQATMGTLGSGLGNWSEHVPDEENDIDVFLTYGDFESVTLEQMYQGANALCVGDEIVQFETETLNADKHHTLDGVLFRGRKNTSPSEWPAGSRVVGLSDVYFMPLDRSYIGRELLIRATTFGTDVQYGTVETILWSVPKSVQEWPVTNVRGERSEDGGLSLLWSPRHRLGTSAKPFPSSTFTGYRLVFSNGSVSKTFETTSRSFAYPASQQLTDFGGIGTLSVTIYALNSQIGPGVGTTVNV